MNERKIKLTILIFMLLLILSGVTAFPVESELKWLLQHKNIIPKGIINFIEQTYIAISVTNKNYPTLAYGYDWLAFAHIVIALSFIGPLKEPVKNIWVIEWAMLACIAVLPLAFIAGPIRNIPLYWQWIDCSFGILGIIPLWFVRKWIKTLEKNIA